MKIPGMKVQFSEEEKSLASSLFAGAMNRGEMVFGQNTKELERQIAEWCGRKHCVLVSSEMAAIEIACKYTVMKKGVGTVLLPATSFYGNVFAIEKSGLNVSLMDVDQNNGVHPTAEMVRQSWLPDTVAMMGFYTAGMVPGDADQIADFCHRKDGFYLEETAHSFGAKSLGRMAGTFGDMSILCLYATKPLHMGEGGAVLTDLDDAAEFARTMRNYGRVDEFNTSVGLMFGDNWRVTEAQAAIGLAKMSSLEANLGKRARAAHELLDVCLCYDLGVHATMIESPPGCYGSWYRFLLMLSKDAPKKSDIRRILKSDFDIQLPGDTYELPVHLQPLFKDWYSVKGRFPQSEDYCERHLPLPIWEGMTRGEMEYVVGALKNVLTKR